MSSINACCCCVVLEAANESAQFQSARPPLSTTPYSHSDIKPEGHAKRTEINWHFWERAGQRHDALKRVAQTPACRLLFLVGVKHVVSL